MDTMEPSSEDRNGGGGNDYRDLKERTLEICREFTRGFCSRSEESCRYAHPPPYVEVKDGKVTICFDFTKNRCRRSNPPCRYMHPPPHLCPDFGSGGKRGGSRGGGGRGGSRMDLYDRYGDVLSQLGNYRAAIDMAMNQSWMGGGQGYRGGRGGSFNGGGMARSDQIEVCREFRRGKCDRDKCRFAHPPDHIRVENGFITYCKDFVINGECKRGDGCRYFHLPPHLLIRYGHKSSMRQNQKRSYDESFNEGSNGNADGEAAGEGELPSAKRADTEYQNFA